MEHHTLWMVPLVLLLAPTFLEGFGDHKFQNMKNLFGFFNRTTKPAVDSPSISRTCNCVCGKKNDGSRIVGGEVTDPHEYPWIVRLSYLSRFYCGGTLINDRYVVTAAHCVKGFMWFLIRVTLGEQDMCKAARKPETRFVIRATIGDFSFYNFKNDIAVLRLNDRVPISDVIRPICLPENQSELYHGKLGTVAGWGTTKEGGNTSCDLREVDMPVISNAECQEADYPSNRIYEHMLCAGYTEGGKDSCQGDSGGPLFTQRIDGLHELIGVVSWGNGCARPRSPGVYTRVTSYLKWILDNSRDACFCDQKPSSSQTTRHPVV